MLTHAPVIQQPVRPVGHRAGRPVRHTIRRTSDHTDTLDERPVAPVATRSSNQAPARPLVLPPEPKAPTGDGMAAPPVPPFEPPPETEALPLSAALGEARPDPFTEETYLPYLLPLDAPVRIAVYTPEGREVAVLIDAEAPAGRHVVRFDADGLAPGTYVCEMETQGYFATRKVTLQELAS